MVLPDRFALVESSEATDIVPGLESDTSEEARRAIRVVLCRSELLDDRARGIQLSEMHEEGAAHAFAQHLNGGRPLPALCHLQSAMHVIEAFDVLSVDDRDRRGRIESQWLPVRAFRNDRNLFDECDGVAQVVPLDGDEKFGDEGERAELAVHHVGGSSSARAADEVLDAGEVARRVLEKTEAGETLDEFCRREVVVAQAKGEAELGLRAVIVPAVDGNHAELERDLGLGCDTLRWGERHIQLKELPRRGRFLLGRAELTERTKCCCIVSAHASDSQDV